MRGAVVSQGSFAISATGTTVSQLNRLTVADGPSSRHYLQRLVRDKVKLLKFRDFRHPPFGHE